MLWRMCGKPAAAKAASFADASADWYQDALSWAVEKGYVNGLSDTRFGPDAPITRQQAMAILFRLNGGQSGTELTLTGIYEQTFADSTTIASWAKDATWWAVYHELAARYAKNISLLALLGVILSYQIIGTAFEWALCGNFFLAVQDFRMGIPGMLIQWFGGYALLKAIAKK